MNRGKLNIYKSGICTVIMNIFNKWRFCISIIDSAYAQTWSSIHVNEQADDNINNGTYGTWVVF